MKDRFLKLIDKQEMYVKSCYRQLHENPELSFQEFETSKFIRDQLSSLNIPFRSGIAKTGVLGKIEGQNPSKKIIALRADMDALPINEETDLGWKSKKKNTMHACGHDAHTACLLGAAAILQTLKNEFEGTVLLIFQPGEEKSPGGAKLMLDNGVFDETTPELIIGQHVSVDYPTGTMAFLPGTIMASADEIHLTIKGKGGHGALPHTINDTVLAASQTVSALQQVRSRLCHPLTPMVLSFGKMIADGATNVIPHEVFLSGTFRTFDEKWREEGKKHIERIITKTCEAYGCSVDIEMPEGYPCVVNDNELTQKCKSYATELLGTENVKDMQMRLTSEDFGFFSQKYPCTFFRFGVKGDSNANSGNLHSSNFKIDEDALKYGTGGIAWLAWNLMTK